VYRTAVNDWKRTETVSDDCKFLEEIGDCVSVGSKWLEKNGSSESDGSKFLEENGVCISEGYWKCSGESRLCIGRL
jgi:hypothetical protein